MLPAINDPTVEKAFILPLALEYQPCSPISRAIQPTLAFDLETRKLVVLREYCRPDFVKEGDIYAILHSHGVPNIEPFRTGNDLRELVTRTLELANKDCARLRRSPGKDEVTLTPFRQYRMTQLTIGRSLTDFRSSKEFVTAIADAMKAHDAAYFKANILHRDISVANILIPDSGGLLIDWDMCVTVDLAQRLTRPRIRTGTWQFMTITLLRNPSTHHHAIEDDREFAFYVLLWTALRFTKHSNSRGSKSYIAYKLKKAFDEVCDDYGECRGGTFKKSFLLQNSDLCSDGCPPLTALVNELCQAFVVRYGDSLLNLFSRNPKASAIFKENINDRQKDLKTENWLVNTLQGFLNADGWPSDDKSEDQDAVVQVPLGHNRTRNQQNASEWPSKKARNITRTICG